MGIQDRDYYRGSGGSFLESLWPSGHVCKWLIGINLAVYVAQLVLDGPDGDWFTDLFLLDTQKVLHGEVWRLLTGAFLHDPTSYLHILFNMLFLWWFGSDLEELYGSREFCAFYLTAAVFANLVYTVGSIFTGHSQALGASGAVTALLVLCALHFPSRTILLFLFLPVPIWLFAVFNVAQDLFTFLSRRQTGVAVLVHLAGAAFAFGYYKQQWRLTSLVTSLRHSLRTRAQPRLRVYRPDPELPNEPVAVSAPMGTPRVDEHFEARLDAVLEKIARTGKESLTEHEKTVLRQASEIYKKRRE